MPISKQQSSLRTGIKPRPYKRVWGAGFMGIRADTWAALTRSIALCPTEHVSILNGARLLSIRSTSLYRTEHSSTPSRRGRPYCYPPFGGDWGLQSSHRCGCGPTKGSESLIRDGGAGGGRLPEQRTKRVTMAGRHWSLPLHAKATHF